MSQYELTRISYPRTDALPLDTLTPLYWTHIECTVAVICACLPSLRTIWLDAAVGNLKSLRSWASKKSLRSSSKGTRQGSFGEGSEPSLPRFEESAGKAESLSSAHRASSQDHKSSPQYNVKGTN